MNIDSENVQVSNKLHLQQSVALEKQETVKNNAISTMENGKLISFMDNMKTNEQVMIILK